MGINKTKINICLCISDLHFGHESCLYKTFWFTVDKLIKDLIIMQEGYDFQNVRMIINGDIVSGTMIYHNQHLESQLQKNDYIIMFGAFLLHEMIKKIENAIKQTLKVFVVAGNHDIGRRPLPHNFSISVARRLSVYGHNVRYTSNYVILDIKKGLINDENKYEPYNVMAFHSWGGADYSSASPSVIREMTRIHAQFSTYKGIIIQRFLVAHTHWLEIGRSVLGIRFDVTGGFMKWEKKVSFRESGMLYYMIDEHNDFQVKPISGLKQQLKEEEGQGLHFSNMKYVANMMEKVIRYEIDLGLLQEPDWSEEIR